jgi:large subunit ribosomal protein L18
VLWSRIAAHSSNNHIYGQVIDDSKDAVLVAASTTEAEMREGNTANQEAATAVGKLLAARALAKGIDKVYFDRNGKKYHGRIMALADGAREGGLSF